MKAVIAELEGGGDLTCESSITGNESKGRMDSKSGKIGEGKGVPLSAAQRKRALQLEQTRQPFVLSNPTYASNPFQVIRTHAQNTLVKHQAHN